MKEEIRELKEASNDELVKKLEDVKGELYFLKVNAKIGQVENTSDIRKKKKLIARILTEINFRKNNEVKNTVKEDVKV